MSIILGIDTSCDDSSAAIIKDGWQLSNIVASQNQIHRQYGGVFPTLAKQAHRENLPAVVAMALKQARVQWSDIDAVAVTKGPGLAPALEVGISSAKNFATLYQKPLIAVNHLEGHAVSALIKPLSKKGSVQKNDWQGESWPKLALVISGGHSEFILIEKPGQYQKLGYTIDDAAGECLDKVGRLLNLGYPAGALIEEFAKKGHAQRFVLPLPMTDRPDFNLSFSGLKTAARQKIAELENQGQLDQQAIFDFAASIQEAVFNHIIYKLERLLLSSNLRKLQYPDRKTFKNLQTKKEKSLALPFQEILLGGGVAANTCLRQKIRHILQAHQKLTKQKISLRTPYSKKLCADNASMIAFAGEIAFRKQKFAKIEDLERQPNLALS